MQELSIFQNIDAAHRAKMLACFGAKQARFHAGERILSYSEHTDSICVMLSGTAHLYCTDEDGSFSLMEYLHRDDVFGEKFYLPMPHLEYIVEADTDCEVIMIGYAHIIQPCQNLCPHHTQIINNLLFLSARKMQLLSAHINILMQKGTAAKLMAYLTYVRQSTGKSQFQLDTTLTELAAYLNVDRISLMRAIRKLNDDGVIASSANRFRLLQ